MINNDQIGDTLAEFYFALRNGNDQGLVYHLHRLTTLYCGAEANDLVAKEILDDCQKKCAQYIRSQYIEQINAIVSSAKKKLASKFTTTGSGSQSQQNKYYAIAMELLGYFSNIIAELIMRHHSMSASLLLAVILPFHERVISMVYECFKQFVEDKKLLKLQKKSLGELSGVILLDTSISGLMMLITVLHQYSNFLANSLRRGERIVCPIQPRILVALDSNSYVTVCSSVAESISGNSNNDDKESTSSSNSTPTSSSSKSTTNTVVVTTVDLKFMQFKEFDLLYTALECLYISKALQEALLAEIPEADIDNSAVGAVTGGMRKGKGANAHKNQNQRDREQFSCKLLLIQGRSIPLTAQRGLGSGHVTATAAADNEEVYVLESMEDVFFILNKSLERALISNSSHSILAVCNKIVEVLDPHEDSQVYRLLHCKTIFDGCVRIHKHALIVQRQADVDEAQATADAIVAKAKAQNEAEMVEMAASRAEMAAEHCSAELAATAEAASMSTKCGHGGATLNELSDSASNGDAAADSVLDENFNQAGVEVAILATTQLLSSANSWWESSSKTVVDGAGESVDANESADEYNGGSSNGDWLSSFASIGTNIVNNTVSTVNTAASTIAERAAPLVEISDGIVRGTSPVPEVPQIDWDTVPLPDDTFSVTVEVPPTDTEAIAPPVAIVPVPPKPVWQRRRDPNSGAMYYVNHLHKVTSWTHPNDPGDGSVPVPEGGWDVAPLPTDTIPPSIPAVKPAPTFKTVEKAVWERRKDAKGKSFYINHQTKETSWVHPNNVAGQQALTLTGSRRLDKLMNYSIGALTPLLTATTTPAPGSQNSTDGLNLSSSVSASSDSSDSKTSVAGNTEVNTVADTQGREISPQSTKDESSKEQEEEEDEDGRESVTEMTKLTSLNDISVYLSTLGVCHNAIQRFESLAYNHYIECVCGQGCGLAVDVAADSIVSGGEEGASQPSKEQTMIFEMILSELERCKGYYQELFYNEAYQYVRPYIEHTLRPLLGSLMTQLNISGGEYDGKLLTESYPMLMELRRALGVPATSQSAAMSTGSSRAAPQTHAKQPEGYIIKELKPGLSSIAYKQILFQIGNFIAESFVARIFADKNIKISEWGALLLQEEVFQIIHLLEDATIDVGDMSDTDDSTVGKDGAVGGISASVAFKNFGACSSSKDNIALIFQRIVWCLKILTLDQPGDAVRYNIPVAADTPIKSSNVNLINDRTVGKSYPFDVVDDDVYSHSWHKHPVLSVASAASSKGGSTNTEKSSIVLFNEKMVRCILSRRVEFSKEHISKLKLVKI